MYEELWKLSAGPLVDVPQAEERVYYFPQGHMEQVKLMLKLQSLFLLSLISPISQSQDFLFCSW